MTRQAVIGNEVSRKEVLFGFLGGGLAWFLHLFFAYGVAEFGCVAGLGEVHWFGLSMVAWLEILIAVATAGLAGAAAYVTYRIEQRLLARPGSVEEARGSGPFLVHGGFLLNLLFLFIILVQSVPLFFYLRSC